MKTRIKVVQKKSGEEVFTCQIKRFGFWWNMYVQHDCLLKAEYATLKTAMRYLDSWHKGIEGDEVVQTYSIKYPKGE